MTEVNTAIQLRRRNAVVIVVALVCVTILLWGFFIWPTPYLYEKVTRPYYGGGRDGNKQEVWRINRFTGRAEKVVDPIPSNP